MKTGIYKLAFTTEVHFGNGTLGHSSTTIYADTLFSALCIEAVKSGRLETLVEAFTNDRLRLSDGFPYEGERLYLPKPISSNGRAKRISQNSALGISQRKKYKNLKFIALDLFDAYLKGEDILERNGLENMGSFTLRSKNSLRNGTDEAIPYHVGTFRFTPGYGLYFILRYEEDKDALLFGELMQALSLSGIGGKRSAGLGKFCLESVSSGADITALDRLLGASSAGEDTLKMLLSVALPKDTELDEAMEGAEYLLVKRSGFVAPDESGRDLLKKKDLYVFSSGSCFRRAFSGDIYDVSKGSAHRVYRYAKPLFAGVKM